MIVDLDKDKDKDKDKAKAEAEAEAEARLQAENVAKKIRAALVMPYVLKIQREGTAESTVEHQCTASIGVILIGKQESSQDNILKSADITMYQAKEAGGNFIQVYDPNTGL